MRTGEAQRDCIERRKRPRISVHWTVYLFRDAGSHPLESTTTNLSSSGFHCCVPEPIPPGERMECAIVIPNHCSQDNVLCLQGNVQVVRLENTGSGYSIGCQILEYSIITLSAQELPRAQPLAQLPS